MIWLEALNLMEANTCLQGLGQLLAAVLPSSPEQMSSLLPQGNLEAYSLCISHGTFLSTYFFSGEQLTLLAYTAYV